MTLWQTAVVVFLLNLPCGAWRAQVRKFSWAWLLAVHLPIPAVVWLRIAGGSGFRIGSFPPLIAAFLLGQWCGGRLGRLWLTRCRRR
jgi:hypothetical protein